MRTMTKQVMAHCWDGVTREVHHPSRLGGEFTTAGPTPYVIVDERGTRAYVRTKLIDGTLHAVSYEYAERVAWAWVVFGGE